jgi:hypothetical protein
MRIDETGKQEIDIHNVRVSRGVRTSRTGNNILNDPVRNDHDNILGKAMSINPRGFCSKKLLGHGVSISPFQ